jgi:hypothetical protein
LLQEIRGRTGLELLECYFLKVPVPSGHQFLYVISGFTIKATRRIRFLWVRVSRYLDIDNKPLGCIGKVSGLLLASLWAVFIGLERALHYLEGH